MISLRIEGFTRVCGKAQGYAGLAVRDVDHAGVNVMETAWEPTPEEIELLRLGQPVIVSIIGMHPPPLKVEVRAQVGL